MSIHWTPIDKPYMHGHKAELGNRSVEFVRCYNGSWTYFAYVDGKQVVIGYEAMDEASHVARARAVNFLRTGEVIHRDKRDGSIRTTKESK